MLQFNYFFPLFSFFSIEVLLFITKVYLAFGITVTNFLFEGLNYFTSFKLYSLKSNFFAKLAN